MADSNQVPDNNKGQTNNENNSSTFGIIKDQLKDTSKIIGDKRFQKFIDYGSTAFVVGSLLMSDEHSKKALAVGIALKVGMGIYKAGGIKEYFNQNVNAAKDTFAEFKDFVQGKEDKAAITSAYVSARNMSNKIDYSGVTVDHAKSSFSPDENDRFKFNGTANYSLNVPAETRKEAIGKAVSCLNADFSNRGLSMRRNDFSLNSVDKVDKGNYVVNCSVSGCTRSTFNLQNSRFYQLGQNMGDSFPRASFASNGIDGIKQENGLFTSFNADINAAKDTLSTDNFMRDMKSFSLCANTAKTCRVNLNRAEVSKQAFEAEFGIGKESGLDKAKFTLKGIRQFGSLDKFAQVRSELDKSCIDAKEAFSNSMLSLKSRKSCVLKSFKSLNVASNPVASDKAKSFSDKVDSFISGLEIDKVSRTSPAFDKGSIDKLIKENENPPFELNRVCSDLKTSAVSCVEANKVSFANLLKDEICNSPGLICKNSLSCDDYFVRGMKEVYSKEGRNASVPKTLVACMIDNYGKDEVSDTLGRLSPDHVMNSDKVKNDIAKASKQLDIIKKAESAFDRKNNGLQNFDRSKSNRNSVVPQVECMTL